MAKRRGQRLKSTELAPEFHKRLRSVRDENGLTRERVSEEIGVTAHTIYRWERGNFAPTEEALNQLCRLYGKPKAWFLYGKEAESPIVAEDQAAYQVADLQERVAKLALEDRQVIEAMLEALERKRR